MTGLEYGAQVAIETIWVFVSENVAAFLVITALAILLRGVGGLDWSRDLLTSVRVNVSFFLLNRLALPFIGFAGALGIQANILAGTPRLELEWWSDVPVWLRVVIALYLGDFIFYWCHRLVHTGWLWPIHAVHHSDRHMNMTTGDRAHPLERMVVAFIFSLVLFWLGAPTASILAVGFFLHCHDAYIHCRFEINHGPFDMVLGSPRMHQWHHADDPRAYGKNLGNLSSLWDRMFGTYYNPGPIDVPFGIPNVPSTSFVSLLAYPFMSWGGMLAKAASRRFTAADRLKV